MYVFEYFCFTFEQKVSARTLKINRASSFSFLAHVASCSHDTAPGLLHQLTSDLRAKANKGFHIYSDNLVQRSTHGTLSVSYRIRGQHTVSLSPRLKILLRAAVANHTCTKSDIWYLQLVIVIAAALFDTVYLLLIKKKHANLHSVHHFYKLQTHLALKIHLTNPHH